MDITSQSSSINRIKNANSLTDKSLKRKLDENFETVHVNKHKKKFDHSLVLDQPQYLTLQDTKGQEHLVQVNTSAHNCEIILPSACSIKSDLSLNSTGSCKSGVHHNQIKENVENMPGVYYCSGKLPIEPVKVDSNGGKIKCLENGCSFGTHRIAMLRKHLCYAHGFKFTQQTLYFQNHEDFSTFRDYYEQSYSFKFSTMSSKQNEKYFYCSLGRRTISTASGTESSKSCTCSMNYKFNRHSGQVIVTIVEEHYGHSLTEEARDGSHLTREEKRRLRELHSCGITQRSIVSMYKSCSLSDKVSAVNKYLYGLNSSERHKYLDSYSVKTTPEIWQDLLDVKQEDLFVSKPMGLGNFTVDGNTYNGDPNLFMLGSMSSAHFASFMQHPLRSVALFRYNNYISDSPESDLSIIYIIAISENKPFIIGFCLSNDKLDITVRFFLSLVKEKFGSILVRFILCNEASNLPLIWQDVFCDVASAKIIPCPWSFFDILKKNQSDNPIPTKINSRLMRLKSVALSSSSEEFHASLGEFQGITLPSNFPQSLANYFSEIFTLIDDWFCSEFAECSDEIQAFLYKWNNTFKVRLQQIADKTLGKCVYQIMKLYSANSPVQRKNINNRNNEVVEPDATDTTVKDVTESECEENAVMIHSKQMCSSESKCVDNHFLNNEHLTLVSQILLCQQNLQLMNTEQLIRFQSILSNISSRLQNKSLRLSLMEKMNSVSLSKSIALDNSAHKRTFLSTNVPYVKTPTLNRQVAESRLPVHYSSKIKVMRLNTGNGSSVPRWFTGGAPTSTVDNDCSLPESFTPLKFTLKKMPAR